MDSDEESLEIYSENSFTDYKGSPEVSARVMESRRPSNRKDTPSYIQIQESDFQMAECDQCGRSFFKSRIEKHTQFCKSLNKPSKQKMLELSQLGQSTTSHLGAGRSSFTGNIRYKNPESVSKRITKLTSIMAEESRNSYNNFNRGTENQHAGAQSIGSHNTQSVVESKQPSVRMSKWRK